jgi:hypothetical protein
MEIAERGAIRPASTAIAPYQRPDVDAGETFRKTVADARGTRDRLMLKPAESIDFALTCDRVRPEFSNQ